MVLLYSKKALGFSGKAPAAIVELGQVRVRVGSSRVASLREFITSDVEQRQNRLLPLARCPASGTYPRHKWRGAG